MRAFGLLILPLSHSLVLLHCQVIGFASRSDAEEYMLEHPESTLGAVYFDFSSSSGINYLIQTNTTVRDQGLAV